MKAGSPEIVKSTVRRGSDAGIYRHRSPPSHASVSSSPSHGSPIHAESVKSASLDDSLLSQLIEAKQALRQAVDRADAAERKAAASQGNLA